MQLGSLGLGASMADKEPITLELDPDNMWTLARDRKALTLNMAIPAVAGLIEPLTVNIDLDYESVRTMILQLRVLSMQMVR